MRRYLLVSVATALLAVSPAISMSPVSGARGPGGPSIQLLGPLQPVTVPVNGKIPIRLRITGLLLDPAAMGHANVPGRGHYHFYVDCIPANAYVRANLGSCWANAAAGQSPDFDLAASHVKISPGTHVLLIALARNDHVLYPVRPVSILFTVVQTPMSVQILSPTHAITVRQNGVIHVALRVSGLDLDMEAMGKRSVPGEGHYHFYVDCISANAYSKANLAGCWGGADARLRTTFNLATSHVKVKPGTHLLLVALARNDHVLYPVPAADLVFTVVPRK